jgi:hypothetical protein
LDEKGVWAKYPEEQSLSHELREFTRRFLSGSRKFAEFAAKVFPVLSVVSRWQAHKITCSRKW